MLILPAIDIIGGNAVRLVKGDYEKMTVFSDNLSEVADGFCKAGAKWLHVVDLDGAKAGKPVNFTAVKRLISCCGMKVEIGGGIRDIQTARDYINAGAERIILGTAALKNPDFLIKAISEFGEKAAVGVDAKNGFAAASGWLESTDKNGVDFCRELAEIGVKTVIYTDISKDGMLSGCDALLYEKLCAIPKLNIIASGGVSSLSDVAALRKCGAHGAIIGKALYTGAIDLTDAIALAGGKE